MLLVSLVMVFECCSVRFGMIPLRSVRCDSVRFRSVEFRFVPLRTVSFGSVPFRSIRFGSVRLDRVPFFLLVNYTDCSSRHAMVICYIL